MNKFVKNAIIYTSICLVFPNLPLEALALMGDSFLGFFKGVFCEVGSLFNPFHKGC